MPPEFLDACELFANALEQTQQRLLEALRLKRAALVTADANALTELTTTAAACAEQLQQLTARRAELIAQSPQPQAKSLSDVLATSISSRAEELRARLQKVQLRFQEVRREAWIHWVIAQRSGSFYTEVLDLIAHGGQRPPGYSDPLRPGPGSGGTVLDAAA
jgi:hypothetical protein